MDTIVSTISTTTIDSEAEPNVLTKILVIGDPHIKPSNIPETKLLISNILKIITNEDPDLVVILGDTLHTHDKANIFAYKEAERMLLSVSKLKPTLFLIGNHDLPGPTSFLDGNHFFTAFKSHPNITIVDTKCEVFYINNMMFAAVPYVPNGRFKEALNTNKDLNMKKVRAVFAHQEFLGCSMNTEEIRSRNGDRWHTANPLIISGHMHLYHRVGSNIVYVGTPRQDDFGDKLDDIGYKTISLFTFTKDKWDEKRIASGIPPKIIIELDMEDIGTFQPPKEGSIKIEIIGEYNEINARNDHPKIKEWKKRGIKVVPNYAKSFKLVDINFGGGKNKFNKSPTFEKVLYETVKDDDTKMDYYVEFISKTAACGFPIK